MKVILSGAVLAASLTALLGAAPLLAQSVAQVGGPSEQPPADFSGQQFVDSRGCVFMRAGFTGQVTWVPRIGRDRKPICNEVTPSQAAARLAQPDSDAPAASVGAPMDTVASGLTGGRKTGVFTPVAVPGMAEQAPAAQPRVAQVLTPPVPSYAPAPNLAPLNLPPAAAMPQGGVISGGASAACPAHAPMLQRLPLAGGGSVSVCTRGDGTATGWFSPNYGGVGGSLHPTSGQQSGGQQFGGQHSGAAAGAAVIYGDASLGNASLGNSGQRRGTGGYVQTVIAGQQVIAPRRDVPSYAAAWKDDRLNPLRGLGTRQGWSDQAQVWTQAAPARTHADVAERKARKAAFWGAKGNGAVRMTQSSMSAATASAATVPASHAGGGQVAAPPNGRIYVQVGTFGQSANAQNAAGRLAGMGLPVASARGVQGGRQLVSIMAGPFGSNAQAAQALAMARSAGFGDAFIR